MLAGSTRWNSQIDAFLNYLQNQPKYLDLIRKKQATGKSELDKLVEMKSILINSKLHDKLPIN